MLLISPWFTLCVGRAILVKLNGPRPKQTSAPHRDFSSLVRSWRCALFVPFSISSLSIQTRLVGGKLQYQDLNLRREAIEKRRTKSSISTKQIYPTNIPLINISRKASIPQLFANVERNKDNQYKRGRTRPTLQKMSHLRTFNYMLQASRTIETNNYSAPVDNKVIIWLILTVSSRHLLFIAKTKLQKPGGAKSIQNNHSSHKYGTIRVKK